MKDPLYRDETKLAFQITEEGNTISGDEWLEFKKEELKQIREEREEEEAEEYAAFQYRYHFNLDPERKNTKYIGKNTFPC